MTTASTSERFSSGASALVYGIINAYFARNLYRNIIVVGKMIQTHEDQCPEKRWLTTARICAILGSCIVVPYWVFDAGCKAVKALSGMVIRLSPIVHNRIETAHLIGWGLLLMAGLAYYFRHTHGSDRCATPADGQRSNIRTLHSQPTRPEPPQKPEGFKAFSGQGYQLGGAPQNKPNQKTKRSS